MQCAVSPANAKQRHEYSYCPHMPFHKPTTCLPPRRHVSVSTDNRNHARRARPTCHMRSTGWAICYCKVATGADCISFAALIHARAGNGLAITLPGHCVSDNWRCTGTADTRAVPMERRVRKREMSDIADRLSNRECWPAAVRFYTESWKRGTSG